jgi:hypothetical protein
MLSIIRNPQLQNATSFIGKVDGAHSYLSTVKVKIVIKHKQRCYSTELVLIFTRFINPYK